MLTLALTLLGFLWNGALLLKRQVRSAESPPGKSIRRKLEHSPRTSRLAAEQAFRDHLLAQSSLSIRRTRWNKYWAKPDDPAEWWLTPDNHILESFLEALRPALEPARTKHALQLSSGDSSLAELVHNEGLARHLLNTDISSYLVRKMRMRYPRGEWPNMSFMEMDSFKMEFKGGDMFDVVFEKGGVSDIYRDRPDGDSYLRQLLVCLVLKAFSGRGGTFITMGFTSRPGTKENLVGVLDELPDLRCRLHKVQYVGHKFDMTGGRLAVFTIKCGAINLTEVHGTC